MRTPLPYGRQCIEDDDIAAVVNVLRSDFLTTGPEVEAFEAELARQCGVRHAIVVSHGTAALHCAYAAAGIGPGDEVVTSPLTFSATANMVLAQQGRPVFADVDERTLCLDPAAAAAAISPRTRAITAVDFAGHPADMDALAKLAHARGLVLIEDAAHALGSRWRGRPVGSLAHMTVFSFHPVKTITTGEGGAVVTNDDRLAERIRDFRNHGMVRTATRLHRQDGPWYYEIQSLGFNYRLSAIHCALGRSQLRKLPRFVQRRAAIARQYEAAWHNIRALRLPETALGAEVAWHLYAVRVRNGAVARRAWFERLQQANIIPQVHYVLVNEMPLYRQLGHAPDQTPVARAASEALVSLPLYPAMSDNDVTYVIDTITAAAATA